MNRFNLLILFILGFQLSGCDVVPETLVKKQSYDWPPTIGKPYPDIEVFDSSGEAVKLSSFKGKVLLIEPIGMSCPACQAFAGAHKVGKFAGVNPQRDLPSIEESFPRFSNGIKLSDKRIVYIQLLLYNMQMKAPSAKDLKDWENHFRVKRHPNRYAFRGTKALVNSASYDMIPGFQLVDKNFILRSDSTGHHPKDDLYRELIPNVKRWL